MTLEIFLARLYTDERLRAEFLANPRDAAMRAGLDAQDAQALERIDRVGLELAATSFGRKRACRKS